MRHFLLVVGLCLTCLVTTMGRVKDENAMRNALEELVMNGADSKTLRNRIDHAFTKPTPKADTCTISVRGSPTAVSEEDPLISSRVECGGEVLHDEEKKLSELKPLAVKDRWLFLFHGTPHGMAYVYLKDAPNIELVDMVLDKLPKLHTDKTYAAPFVAEGGKFDCNGCNFTENVGGEKAGALVLGGDVNADITGGDFYANQGTTVGALHLLGKAKLDIENTIIEENIGTVVGGMMIDEDVTLTGKELFCYNNEAKEQATAMYITGKAIVVLDETHLVGNGYNETFREYLLDPEQKNQAIGNMELPETSAIKIMGKTVVSVSYANFSGNAAKYGALVAAEDGVVSMRDCNFEKNAAINGAGVYIEGGRGGYARMMDCTFVSNVARNGGALVSAGNGSFVIDECHFESNIAYKGGAVWGDYSNGDSLVANSTCSNSAGSRMTIQKSTFKGNEAVNSGGAFYVKCTDIFTNESSFTGNLAKSNGGAMYIAEVHDLDFLKCAFEQNSAGESGGSLYVENSHDILSRNTSFSKNTAKSNGGAIASLKGNGIYMTQSTITDNSGSDGGAIYSLAVKTIRSEKTDLTRNAADQGGALSMHELDELYLEDVDFSKNTAKDAGGAVRAYNGTLATIKNIIVTDITSGSGSLALEKIANVHISNIDFHDNIAEKSCGALEVDRATDVELTDLTVRQNVAKQEGGGICVTNTETAHIQDVKFSENKAGNGGGALLFGGSKNIALNSTEFVENVGTYYGGAIKGGHVESLVITFSNFERNEAQLRGGAIYLKNSSLDIEDSTVSENYVGQPRPKKATELETETAETEKTESKVAAKEEEVAEAETEAVKETTKTEKTTEAAEKTTEGTAMEETKEVATKEQPETDDPSETIVSANRALATDAGGVIYVSEGAHFRSLGTNYTFNEAQSVGGAVMVEDMALVEIQFDVYLNGTAALSGGCIYGANIGNFSMWDTTLQYCEASNGGAFIMEGTSMSESGYNKFINNTAESGGAFLCKGNSRMNMTSNDFQYNAAKEGATLSIDCHCDVDVEYSAFYRDKDLKGNGDFFHVSKGCGSINHNGCEFHGKKPHNGMGVLRMGLGGGFVALVIVFFVIIVLARRRSKKRAAARGDIETGTSAPLLAGRRPVTAASTESSSSYETESEEYYSTESDDVRDVDRNPRKRSSARSIEDSEEEDISSEETENDTAEDEEITVAKRQPRAIPTVPVVPPKPIGLRTPKEVRAVNRHRKAFMDALNDGAGPSLAASSDILPPTLPPKLTLTLSMSSEHTPSPPEAFAENKAEEGEIQPEKAERQPTIPEDTV